jgi:hypothetical protein
MMFVTSVRPKVKSKKLIYRRKKLVVMDKPFQVIINPTYEGVSITIIRRSGFNFMPAVAKPIILEFEELKNEGDPFPPTLILNHIEAEFFLNAWKEALEPVGKKREREIRMKAKIDAQEEHLKDLRKIIEVFCSGAKRRITLGED